MVIFPWSDADWQDHWDPLLSPDNLPAGLVDLKWYFAQAVLKSEGGDKYVSANIMFHQKFEDIAASTTAKAVVNLFFRAHCK